MHEGKEMDIFVQEIIKVLCGNFHAFQRVWSVNKHLRSEPVEIVG